ncbi:hypothetical protein [Legionella parisiensis]|uniref:Dot/Icm T4SS effector n=1 Tax=Legionella parisiensis TaxID=45071 RepID=A0A1E5JQ25_9GAMM|nr:hypothetical protein [Legionella parisiensis]KTD42892.1 Dot/Icm T4SS effector [Legionella parisiensis]OEH46629.1 hypothetical protein lpari_02416 [Legionella parisiensis]STX78034.1 Dot/Icm T4SS effector [Legionella parisiensis]
MFAKFSSYKFFDKSVNISKSFLEMGNPAVGNEIIKLQKTSILVRLDGRAPSIFHQQGGILPRIPRSELLNVRHSTVCEYQRFNKDPFGWGACASLKDLMVFIDKNKSQAQYSWIHKFYGKSTSLMMLKYKTGIESEGHDNENEEIIVEHIPFSQFIASTCPKYREKFMSGGLVPNFMHDYNADLPKTMRISDLLTEKDVLTWLMINNAEKTFVELCKTVYADMPEEKLGRLFLRDQTILSEVRRALESTSALQM